jgi:type I restriction enzyme S subunit
MSSEWKYVPLGDVCSRITYGFTNPMPTIDGDGAYMVTAKDIKNGRIQYQAARRTSWDAYRGKLTDKSRPVKGDLLLTKDGSIGRLALCDRDDICINQSVALLQSNGKGDFRYIKYVLEAPEYQRQMEAGSDGSTIKHIYITRVDKMMIPLPPRKEQEGIISILGTLDDKIELNRKTNETLEAMAKALFKSWFVDFDPVRAKAEGRPTGLPAEISDLFSDSFEDSELGEIPSGWRVGSIYEVSSVIYGAPFSSSLFNSNGEGVPVVRIRDLPTEAPAVFTTEIHPKGTLIKPGDIVVGMDGEFRGYLWGGNECWMNQRVCQFVPKTNDHSCFVMESIRKPLMEVEMSETATTVIHLGKGDIDRFKIVIPSQTILDLFGVKSKPLLDTIVRNKKESRSLTQLRDTLLPKLISGEIRIPDAERMLEEVGV